MTFGKILDDISTKRMSLGDAYKEMSSPEKMKTINYYVHIRDIRTEALTDVQLQELEQIVEILQILYTSDKGSPLSDTEFDILQEMLVDMGIPRLVGSIEINDHSKVNHTYENIYGTLGKVYYLSDTEERTNKSRKTLDEWIASTERTYEENTGKKINLNEVDICIQPKFDGVSAGLEWNGKKALWLTRGKDDRASDITQFLKQFNDIYCGAPSGQKFEIMCSEESKDKINELFRRSDDEYSNSRQVVISAFNQLEPDFKTDYLYPVPLRIMGANDKVERIHPMFFEKFPHVICKFKDKDKIREFANKHHYVEINGFRLRTDGAVLTILDQDICIALGRDRKTNNFEVAYKFTEESAYTTVKNVEFYVSEFGYITPVLVVNDVILKGNKINHISLSNKERFEELNLSYGDEVKILYDIIPYATIDKNCKRISHGRKIEFITRCPRCHEELDLNAVQVQCKNPHCPSKLIGKVMNYCSNLRIASIGYRTLEALYVNGFLDNGITSLYKLKKKKDKIEMVDGFGRLKTRKMIREVEAKRRLKDYEFFGAYGIEGISKKTFYLIFESIPMNEFIQEIKDKKYDIMRSRLINIQGIGNAKAGMLVDYLSDNEHRKELMNALKEVILTETYGKSFMVKRGVMVFTGCRPDDELRERLEEANYEVSDSWKNSATTLVVPRTDYQSSKVAKALEKGIRIITIDECRRANYDT